MIRKVIQDNRSPRIEGLPSLTGGLIGYFSYEYLQYGEPELQLAAEDKEHFDDVNLMLFDKLICYDHLKQKLLLIVNIRTADLETEYNKAVLMLDEMEKLVRYGKPKKIQRGQLKEPLRPKLSREAYTKKVEEIKHYIHEGDIFQLVFSNLMQAAYEGSLLNTYRILRTTNPSPYMFYFSGNDVEIAVAGTRRRGRTVLEDEQLERELLADEKERAEHNMLVDLGRNDLGRLCRFGSVRVERYMDILRYSKVMHIGSEVRGLLRDDVSAIDTVDSVLPAGTLSGAPKFRACELISQLEGDRRGLYGGAVGYVDFGGNLDVCIAIRLAYKKNGKVFVRSGAGIVADSIPDQEYQECMNKASAVIDAIRMAEEVEE